MQVNAPLTVIPKTAAAAGLGGSSAAAGDAAPYLTISRGAISINDGAGSAFAILSDNVSGSVRESVRVTRTSVDIEIDDSIVAGGSIAGGLGSDVTND